MLLSGSGRIRQDFHSVGRKEHAMELPAVLCPPELPDDELGLYLYVSRDVIFQLEYAVRYELLYPRLDGSPSLRLAHGHQGGHTLSLQSLIDQVHEEAIVELLL